MKIPVSHISKFGTICGCILFDTITLKFTDSDELSNRMLPVQDFLSCNIQANSEMATLVGKAGSNFIICFGDTLLHSVDEQTLSTLKLSNRNYTADNKISYVDGTLQDLSALFPDSNLKFVKHQHFVNASSLGIAKKFIGNYQGNTCVVKFSKLSSNEDLMNELLYMQIADILAVPCCKVIQTTYSGKPCVASLFAYHPETDCFRSFKTCGGLEKAYNLLTKEDQHIFNKMMILDYLMSQQDRHMSNLAIVNDKIYPLFDNGECLGLSAVSIFSDRFRKYVLRLDKKYIQQLIKLDKFTLDKISFILNNKINIFIQNAKELRYDI